MLRIGVDLDNTLADFSDNVIRRFEKDFSTTLSTQRKQNVFTYQITKFLSTVSGFDYQEIKDWFYEEMNQKGFFLEQKPIEGYEYFFDFVREFKDRIDLYFVTAVSPLMTYAYKDKIEWIAQYMKIYNPQMVFTTHKYLVNVDVFIDDSDVHCDDWIEKGNPEMIFILFPQPYNRKYYKNLDADSGVFRPKGWIEICEYLRQSIA